MSTASQRDAVGDLSRPSPASLALCLEQRSLPSGVSCVGGLPAGRHSCASALGRRGGVAEVAARPAMQRVWAVGSRRGMQGRQLLRRPRAHPPESTLAVGFDEVLKPGHPSLSAQVEGPSLLSVSGAFSVMSVM